MNTHPNPSCEDFPEYHLEETLRGIDPLKGRPWQRGAVCTKCHKLKLQREFEYFLSGAQAEARGYARNVRVKYDSGLICRACRPRKRKLVELSERELWTRAQIGDIPKGDAEERIAQRRASAKYRAAQAADDRWQREYTQAWKPIIDGLNREVLRITTARSAHKLRPELVQSPFQASRIAFFDAYYNALRVLRVRLKQSWVRNPRGRKKPSWPHWDNYFDDALPGERRKLALLWEAIPFEGRLRMRIPHVVNVGARNQEPELLYKVGGPDRRPLPVPVPSFMILKKAGGQAVPKLPAHNPALDDPFFDSEEI